MSWLVEVGRIILDGAIIIITWEFTKWAMDKLTILYYKKRGLIATIKTPNKTIVIRTNSREMTQKMKKKLERDLGVS